jgi:hypothetical protein
MKNTYLILLGLALSVPNANAQGKKTSKAFGKISKSALKKKSKKKSKTMLFDKAAVKKGNKQHFRNAYLMAVVSKLAYQPEKKKDQYRDDKLAGVKSKKGKIKTGGRVNPKRFAKFGLELCNPDMPYWTIKKDKNNKKFIDAQAYLVHNDSSVILAFRGTKEKADWKTNADAVVKYKLTPAKKYGKNTLVHRGWLNATEQAHKQFKLQSEIKACLKKDGKKRKLFVTGHSLGGAMATLWTYYFRKDKKVQASRLYTYGAPSAGNKDFGKSFKKLAGKKLKSYSWVNQDDPVTGITWSLGFRRTGKPQWITCKGLGQLCKESKLVIKSKIGVRAPGPASMHDMTTYMNRILKLAPKSVNKQLTKLGAGKKVNKLIKSLYK